MSVSDRGRIDPGAEIERMFDLATLRREGQAYSRAIDWEKHQEIKDRHAKIRAEAQETYEREYDTRFEAALKARIEEAGGKARDFTPPWSANDRFDKDQLVSQAHRDVQFDHDRRWASLESLEAKELKELSETIQQRDGLQSSSDVVRSAFAQSAQEKQADLTSQFQAPAAPTRAGPSQS